MAIRLKARQESDVVAAAHHGDAEAMQCLIDRYAGPAYARACRLTGDPDLAHDVAQDAMVTALAQLGSLRNPERFVPWLTTIIDRVAARAMRQDPRARERPLADADGHGALEAPASDRPDRLVEEGELRRVVRLALDATRAHVFAPGPTGRRLNLPASARPALVTNTRR